MILQQGQAVLNRVRETSLSREVVYIRAATNEQITVRAMPGQTRGEAVTNDDVVVEVRTQDWTVTAADLRIGAALFRPAAGDQIRDTVGGQTVIYRVIARPGLDAWSYQTADRTSIRIRTTAAGGAL
ncbi:MAG: hypothetical protein ACK5WB_00315 [Phycisphaerales bacterium]|nr:hypothetical protein [Phycisphaeraceae bacterium]